MQTLNIPFFYGMASLLVDHSNTAWLDKDTAFMEAEKDQIFLFLMNESVYYPKVEREKAHRKSLFAAFIYLAS